MLSQVLIKAYGLPPQLARYQPSEFLWPNVTSKRAEEFVRNQVSSNDPRPGVIWTEQGLIKGALAKVGLSFPHLQPVIFIPPDTMDKLQGYSSLADLATPDNLALFSPVVEEVSHFLYQQSQYLHNKKIPGIAMHEAVTMLDWYLVLKNLGNSSVQEVGELWQSLTEKRERIPFMYQGLLDYKHGYRVMTGFVEYLMKADRAGNFDQDELRKFYLMDGKSKMDHLLKLYQDLNKSGQKSYYTKSLDVESYQAKPEFA